MLNAKLRRLFAGLITAAFLVLLAGALTIPFVFESSTLYYKFGSDKILLRSGKMVGLAAALLLLLQMVLAARFRWLDRVFSLPRLHRLHRLSAGGIVFLVLLHPVLVFIPDDMLMIPLEARYWPEWVGAGCLVLILAQAAGSKWRTVLFKRYERWLAAHRAVAVVILGLLLVHILYVSETFERAGPPRSLALTAAGCLACIWIWMRLRNGMLTWSFRLSRIEKSAENAYTLTLEPAGTKRFTHLPGQFAFVSVRSKALPPEYHPFTIVSSPFKSRSLQFTIRGRGDWTDRISGARVGDRVDILGPFGCFSHLYKPDRRGIIMIAGGIGITPMLSMLRYMRDTGDRRRILLLWSNRTPGHLFADRELTAMARQLTGFQWVPIFTRKHDRGQTTGRLDRARLAVLLREADRDAFVFLCGPPRMMAQLREDLKALGFSPKDIVTETFGF